METKIHYHCPKCNATEAELKMDTDTFTCYQCGRTGGKYLLLEEEVFNYEPEIRVSTTAIDMSDEWRSMMLEFIERVETQLEKGGDISIQMKPHHYYKGAYTRSFYIDGKYAGSITG